VKIKVRALRRKVWFKALSRVERGVIDLTIRCVEQIRSHALMKLILAIVDKLLRTLEENYLTKVERAGREIAEKICELARKWGNLRALLWKYDLDFVRFLGMNAVNG
jgi:hypothetical protein